VHIVIAHSAQEGGTTQGSRSRTDNCYGCLVGGWKICRKIRVSDLGHAHLLKDTNGQLLQPVDLDSSLLGVTHIAVPGAELADGAELAASETQWVVG
jgi:hypothetical protein